MKQSCHKPSVCKKHSKERSDKTGGPSNVIMGATPHPTPSRVPQACTPGTKIGATSELCPPHCPHCRPSLPASSGTRN